MDFNTGKACLNSYFLTNVKEIQTLYLVISCGLKNIKGCFITLLCFSIIKFDKQLYNSFTSQKPGKEEICRNQHYCNH